MQSEQWLGGYRLIRRLGTGGAGTVWLAEDGAGERVALKLLHPALAASEAARARLTRESTTVNSVRSSGVAHVVDVETDDAQPFVVSEFIEGPTLATRLRSGALPPRELAALADALRHILDAVHAAQVVHRDVKPSNVILSPTGPVLIDFGIAMGPDDEHLTGTGLVSGTAGFAAPELLRGGEASASTDWWGWAATVLNAATGRAPYGSGGTQAVSSRVLADEPDVDGLPRGVAGLLAWALRADARRRPDPALVCERLADHGLWSGAGAGSGPERTTVLPTAHEGASAQPEAGAGDATQVLGRTSRVTAVPGGVGGESPVHDRTEVLPESFPPSSAPDIAAGYGTPTPGETEVMSEPPVAPTALLPADAAAPATGVGTPSSVVYPQVQGAPSLPAGPPPAYGGLPPSVRTPPWPAPGPAGMQPGVQAWPLPGYQATRPRPVPVVGVFVLALLAALPVVLGRVGLVAAGLVLLGLAGLGSGRAWRERRRVRAGGTRRSDTPLAVTALPLHLVTSALGLAVGLTIGAIASTLGWLAAWGLLADPPPLGWPLDALGAASVDLGAGSWITTPLWQAVLWGLVWVGLLLMWVLPTSSGARDGLAIVVHSTLGPTWSRALACVILGGVVAATWVITTGGPF